MSDFIRARRIDKETFREWKKGHRPLRWYTWCFRRSKVVGFCMYEGEVSLRSGKKVERARVVGLDLDGDRHVLIAVRPDNARWAKPGRGVEYKVLSRVWAMMDGQPSPSMDPARRK